MASPRGSACPKAGKYKFIVSACLAGADCTFDGKNKLNSQVLRLVKTGLAITICPEVMGGASIPRQRCEISSGGGGDVLDGRSCVRTISGRDVTDQLIYGALCVLSLTRSLGIRYAIFKSKSPSCGRDMIYDGTFKRRLRPGDGVTTALLLRNKIKVFTEKEARSWPVKSIS